MHDGAGRRVLIVEDEPLLLEVSMDAFADAGYIVVPAASGELGVAALSAERPFDLLFTDVRMPGRINGWAMAAEARRQSPDIAVIYATGFAEEVGEMVPDAVLMRKPYRMRAVLNAAAALISGNPPSDAAIRA